MPLSTTSNIWTDANGFTRLTTFNNDGTSGPIQAQIEAASNARLQRYWQGQLHIPSGVGVTGVYQSVQDAAVLSYQSASGAISKLVVPAPLLSIFGADGQTVNPAAIAALTAAVLADMLDANGMPIVSFLGGFYQRSGKVLVGG